MKASLLAVWGSWRFLGLAAALTAVGLILIIYLGLKGSRGGLAAFIDGQFDLGPVLDDPAVSVRPPAGPNLFFVTVAVDPSRPLRRVDTRYLSFAIDTSAVVGGKWWDPKAEGSEGGSGTVHAPIFDFDRPRLDTLTRALAPAYLRVGGSEADKLYYDMSPEEPERSEIPFGFESVLTRRQWDAVHAFARRNELEVVMTLNAGPAVRDPNGAWQPQNAETLLEYTYQRGYEVSAWELGNELNLFWYVHGLGTQVSPEQYHRDLLRLEELVRGYDPQGRVAGQGAAFWPVLGEPLAVLFGFQGAYLRRSGRDTNLVSWHYYPQQGRRGPIASRRATRGRLLDPNNLNEVAHWADHNARLRDAFSPGTPLWLAETGHAQFGGEPGLSDRYLASLWWLDQLGLLAIHHHDVVVRQTLAGSNYQLITDNTLEPLPDYWASLLFRRLMGPEVLRVEVKDTDRVRAYAHREPTSRRMSLLLINLDPRRGARVRGVETLPTPYEIYRVTAPDLFGTEILLNGTPLRMDHDDRLPPIHGVPLSGPTPEVEVPPLSYAFVVSKPDND